MTPNRLRPAALVRQVLLSPIIGGVGVACLLIVLTASGGKWSKGIHSAPLRVPRRLSPLQETGFGKAPARLAQWRRFRLAARGVARPERYPHRSARHPSVRDDFDVVMAITPSSRRPA